MKKIVRLTESDLTRIVKRVIKEDIQNNELYLTIKDVMRNTNSGDDEKIQVLKYIIRELEGDGWVTKDKVRKLWNMNEIDNELPSDLDENEDSFLSKRKNKKEMRDAARKWVNSKSKEERKEIEMNFKGHDGWVDAIGSAYDEQW